MDEQVSAWEQDPNQFGYDIGNGDVKVLNSKQLQQKATRVREHTTNRSTKSKMSRLINQAKRNPHMHRIANIWNKRGTYGKETKTASYWNNPETLREAMRAQAFKKFAKAYNKVAKHKIVTAKQMHVGVHDGGEKIGEGQYNRYPKINSAQYNSVVNGRYNNGLKDTINYVIHNYPTVLKPQVKQFKSNLTNIDKDLKYTRDIKRMKSAKRTSHRRKHTTVKEAYAEKYGVGNDHIDVGPGIPIESDFEQGLKQYKIDQNFVHKVQAEDKHKQEQAPKPKVHKKHRLDHHIVFNAIGFGSPEKDKQIAEETKRGVMGQPKHFNRSFSSQVKESKTSKHITAKQRHSSTRNKNRAMMRKQDGRER